MSEHYEAVVVGAGPAGLSAAMELARNGVETLVLERGKAPGAKNATGGILYGQTNTKHNLDAIVPHFENEAPVERSIHDYHMHALHGDKVKTLDLTRLHAHEMAWSYSVLRRDFDKWLGDEVHQVARKAGGGVLTDIRVTGPLMENGKVVGVETNELDPIKADLVIAADGATSEMARKAGLRQWGRPENWFQGAKVVVKLPSEDDLKDRMGIGDDEVGNAHLFAGDLFGDVRGGGFVYTNKDTLSIGTVFHLDSLAAAKVEPHRLMDRLIKHPMVQEMIGPDGEEVEYSAKLIPDGKKMAVGSPHNGNMIAIGDAAGQLQAQGPVIKGMNLGISSGIMAAQAFVRAKEQGNPGAAGAMYTAEMRSSYVWPALKPFRYQMARLFGENALVNGLLSGLTKTIGKPILATGFGQNLVQGLMSSPFWAGANPDINFSYVTLPSVLADAAGEVPDAKGDQFDPRTLEERIAALTYDTAVGNPHIELLNDTPRASGAAVHTCPVSARDFSLGCYRQETVKTPDGGEKEVVALDTQPCIECGTCALMADTHWEHPPGGKGVEYKFG